MQFIQNVLKTLSGLDPYLIVAEVIVFTVIFYLMMKVLKDNNAKILIWIFVTFLVLLGVGFLLIKSFQNVWFVLYPILFLFCVIILFSTEIKRVIWNFYAGKNQEIKHVDSAKVNNTARECTNEIIKALQNMSKNDIGALIIITQSNLPNSILESGVYMDSEVSSELIESIFFPKTPLHDGAMVIKGTKIQAAGCFLPLSQEVNIPKDLGTRHRAGIGITETINVTAFIVSEETGVISIASGGKIKRYADSEMLRQTLNKFYSQEQNN